MGSHLVLYNLDTCVASEYILAVLDGGGGAYVDAYRCVELQRVTSGSRFRRDRTSGLSCRGAG